MLYSNSPKTLKPWLLVTGTHRFPGNLLLPSLRKAYRLVLVGQSSGNAGDVCVDQLQDVDPKLPLYGVLFFSQYTPLDKQWTSKKQQELLNSRRLEVNDLMDYLAQRDCRPNFVILESSINIYGVRKDKRLFECATTQPFFISKFYSEAERLAQTRASDLNIRLVPIRLGHVLSNQKGLATRAMQIFGNDEQWLSWIHEHDFVRLVLFIMNNPRVDRPVNVCSAHPQTYKGFCDLMKETGRRVWPLRLPAPIAAVGAESRSQLLCNSHRALPGEALKHGFCFDYKTMEAALAALSQESFESLTIDADVEPAMTMKNATAKS